MQHPNFLDRFYLKLNPRYLYSRQLSQLIGRVQIGIVHKLPQTKPFWQQTDTVKLEKGTLLRFLGLARNLHFTGDIDPLASLFEMVRPVPQDPSSSHLTNAGDLICITPLDRKFVYPAPESLLANQSLPFRTGSR